MKLSAKMELVLSFLRSKANPSSKEIEDACVVCSARDWVRHLRDKGFNIEQKDEWFGASRVSRWRLIEDAPVARELFQQ